jgi:hypothetical protein
MHLRSPVKKTLEGRASPCLSLSRCRPQNRHEKFFTAHFLWRRRLQKSMQVICSARSGRCERQLITGYRCLLTPTSLTTHLSGPSAFLQRVAITVSLLNDLAFAESHEHRDKSFHRAAPPQGPSPPRPAVPSTLVRPRFRRLTRHQQCAHSVRPACRHDSILKFTG